ncbi:heavy metal translocating P-type ATPase [Geodermatophilus sp. DSM 44513]|uniref:heavy metal translocating P-type ATPase n=1 Tax=Geodermatophilus sp. DSM 44513 TaxID=1528104 RepID=UPI0028F7128E|nr:heavy metal translocating P-type ATPase [Geodermatophilus sp. DSM 44513]WNV76955.1 heavy metal translocating P-type ATPase [Geodermatophilus sp. DSM 44513]
MTSPARTTAPPAAPSGVPRPPAAPASRRPAALAAAWSLPEVRWAALSLALFAVGAVAQLAGAPAPVYWGLYLACYAAGGWEPALAGLQALRERTLDVDLLMVVAAIGAASIGQVFDGALLIVIFATSGALEAFATRRTADAVRGLSRLAPEQAAVLGPDGAERLVPVAELAVGDRVLVRPGERVPADGTVVDGSSDVDQASITGEPLPVDKAVGDDVYAGTANGTGALVVRVGRDPGESVVARIGALVEEASATKARTQLFIERVEQRYSVGVVVATLAVFGIPLLAGSAVEDALLRAMTFMIVASPCAIVLATMPPLLSAVANAGRHGVLVRSAVAMEQLGSADLAAFDKTGTLTDGHPAVVDVRTAPGVAADEVLRLAASAEAASEHPIGRAVVRAAGERGLPPVPATGFRAEVGSGVTATVAGRVVRVGAPRPEDGAVVGAAVDEVLARGRTAVVVSADGAPLGVLAVADRVRPEAPAAVAALRGLLPGEPVLLTGDDRRAAEALAGAVGLREVHAGLLPQGKVDAVRALQAGGRRVLLVGDGVNDAPALATADVGVAMGGIGSDLALDTADVVVVRDDLSAVPAVVELSRRARRVVVQNLVIAGTLIGVLVVWGLVGTLPLPLGVAGHEGSTVLVALNGLRLLRRSAWQPPPH